MHPKLKYTLIVVMLLNGVVENSFAQTSSAKIKDMSKDAEVILTGKVVKNESFWNENKTNIFTKSSLLVEEFIKGNETKKIIQVVCPGGEVGDVGELYTHMPTLTKNEEVLLFLRKDQTSSSYKVLNGEDGKIPVFNDDASGKKITSTKISVKSLKEEIKKYINE